ncbi:DUF6702 family protein [Flavobacterium sp.]|uniref:DUF6702 family protein n=1 Tax=Flavobacterium sp. TaxID=239 RepID=UPI00120E0D2A|nr:DUF6702 family protein [Flavobacterium sp.]RZJ71413.1 MAG: hypothetical protein EOO49_10150 [Flavobacterium sp.]
MKKLGIFGFLIVLALAISSFSHKFYVGIYQMNFASDKKMLQITSRIFVDDLNNALGKKFKKKFHFGDKNVPPDEVDALKKYISDNFKIGINGKPQVLDYRSCEVEDNVLICYLRITDVSQVNSLQITNKILFDFVTEQQNIIQTNVGGNKQSLLLTFDEPSGKLNF